MTTLFTNGSFQDFKSAIQEKKSFLLLCKTDKTKLGLFIVDPISFNTIWRPSPLHCLFNIQKRKKFQGQGSSFAWDEGERYGNGGVRTLNGELDIRVKTKAEYLLSSNSRTKDFKITKDENGINAITQDYD